MNTKYILPRLLIILLLIVTFASCEEDFSTIGADVIGGDGSTIQTNDTRTVKAYSKKLAPVATNALPLYQLGAYSDPVFGASKVDLLAQITMDETDPDFGEGAVVDSVLLYIPYFSNATTTQDTVTYELDSVYGNSPIDIKLYESTFFLQLLDPASNFEEFKKYYADEAETFENFLGQEIITIEDFVPSNEGFVLNEGEDDEERIAPGLRVLLPKEFFDEKILQQEGMPSLLSNNNFLDYFRGIYFDIEAASDATNLFLFDIANASITMHYSFDGTNDDDGNQTGRDSDTFTFSFNRVNVNLFENDIPQEILNNISDAGTLIDESQENLYLKGGGDGIITIIELFGEDTNNDGVPEELEELRNREWLINEANLIFYVDQDKVTPGELEPERIIIFDATNKQVLPDFGRDITASQSPTVNALTIHLGRLERGSDEAGDFYKIRITDYVSNLINNDSTSTALGLMVSQNVLLPGFKDLQNTQSPDINGVPTSSVISPEGTVLYGTSTTNEEKRLKLQILYTCPDPEEDCDIN